MGKVHIGSKKIKGQRVVMSSNHAEHTVEVVYVDRPVEVFIPYVQHVHSEPTIVEKIVHSGPEIQVEERIVYAPDPELQLENDDLKYKLLEKETEYQQKLHMLYDEIETDTKSLVRHYEIQKIDRKRKKNLVNKLRKEKNFNRNLKIALAVSFCLTLLAFFI